MSRLSFPSPPANALTGRENRKPQWPDAQPRAGYDVLIARAGRHGPSVGKAGGNITDDRFRITLHLLAGICRAIELGILRLLEEDNIVSHKDTRQHG